jgi:hypothetical protein
LKNAEVEQIGGLLLSTVKVTNAFTLTKSGLGHILGDFLANSSGHPACAQKNDLETSLQTKQAWPAEMVLMIVTLA